MTKRRQKPYRTLGDDPRWPQIKEEMFRLLHLGYTVSLHGGNVEVVLEDVKIEGRPQ